MKIVYPKPEEILFHDGPYFTVEWYYTEGGHLPALDYYKRMAEVDQHKLKLIAKYLADNPYGTQLPMTMYRIEDRENKIFASSREPNASSTSRLKGRRSSSRTPITNTRKK